MEPLGDIHRCRRRGPHRSWIGSRRLSAADLWSDASREAGQAAEGRGTQQASRRQVGRNPYPQQVDELERKIQAQIIALEEGVEPELVSERIGEHREQKEALEDALSEIHADRAEAEDEELVW